MGKKRGQNEGSIYKRQDGRWTSVINLGFERGKPKRLYFYGRTREEVAGKLAESTEKRRQGLPVAFDRQTLSDFLDGWLENCVKQSVRPNTYYSYEQNLRLYVKPVLGSILLTKLTPQHIQAFMNNLIMQGRSPRLVHYQRTVLRCALNQAVKWSLVARNVASLVDPPRYRKTEIVPLDSTEVKKLLLAIKGDPFETIFHVALTLGLREGEVLGLRWEDINLRDRTLRVSSSLQRIEKELRLVELKTERSRRTLPIPDNLLLSIKSHRTRQLKDQLLAGDDWRDELGLVFTTSHGTPLYARNVVRSYHRVLAVAKIPRRRFHDLRHSCATFLLAKNVPARTVMEILGHSNINLTMNTYSHVMPDMLRDAANAMNTIMAGKRAGGF